LLALLEAPAAAGSRQHHQTGMVVPHVKASDRLIGAGLSSIGPKRKGHKPSAPSQ
jgi:hypothetical protein